MHNFNTSIDQKLWNSFYFWPKENIYQISWNLNELKFFFFFFLESAYFLKSVLEQNYFFCDISLRSLRKRTTYQNNASSHLIAKLSSDSDEMLQSQHRPASQNIQYVQLSKPVWKVITNMLTARSYAQAHTRVQTQTGESALNICYLTDSSGFSFYFPWSDNFRQVYLHRFNFKLESLEDITGNE